MPQRGEKFTKSSTKSRRPPAWSLLERGLEAGSTHTQRLACAAEDARLEALIEPLLETKRRFVGSGHEQCAGRLAEVWHAGTFNAAAVRIGSKLRAVTTASMGAPGDPADVLIKLDQEIKLKVQLKFCNLSGRTMDAIADRRYDGMQRVVPADQVRAVRRLAASRGIDGLGKRNFPATAAEASATIRSGRVSSAPLSRADAQNLVRQPEVVVNQRRTVVGAGAVGNAALGAALIAVGISAVTDAKAVHTGQKSLPEATRAAGTAALRSGASAAVGTAVTLMARRVCSANPAAAIGGIAADLALNAVELQRGQIDRAELLNRSASSVARAVGTAAGAALGSALLPGLGTAVGSTLGGMAADALLSAARQRPQAQLPVIPAPLVPRKYIPLEQLASA